MARALMELRDQVATMLAEAEKATGNPGGDYFVWSRRRRNEEANLARRLTTALDARIKVESQATVSIAGIRSTSTSGLFSAVRNWLTAADKRLAAEGSS